jgi:predicted aspartyl protease
MVTGKFINSNQPIIQAVVGWRQAVQTPYFLLDTGFTGDLQVTPEIARELGLEVSGATKARFADGTLQVVPTASAIANMEGTTNYVQVIISNSIPLMGISFLEKFQYKAIVNCKYKTVNLEKVE